MRHLLILLIWAGTWAGSAAQGHFRWTPTLRQAYEAVLSLRFERAENLLEKVRRTDPDNLLVLHLENYMDFFRVYINEDPIEFARLEKNKNARLERIRQGPKNSPYYLYLQANIRLQWALARLKFEQYTTAFFEVNKAFKLLNRNAGRFPGFVANKKELGILHAMVGTIPDGYRWAVEWLSSLSGSIEQGRRELEEVMQYARQHDFIYEKEVYVFYAYLLLHLENDTESAWNVIRESPLDPSDNPLACFVLANVAMRTDRGNEAIALLENTPRSSEFLPFPYLDYMTGLAKLRRLDPDADRYLLAFLQNFRGRHFIKDAYQKLAWHHFLQGNEALYHFYLDQCLLFGNTVVGSDKSAQKEAEFRIRPRPELLRARLLFDGGFLDRAYALLNGHRESDYSNLKHRLEFSYRKGRIAQKLGKDAEALRAFERTIELGQDAPWYFACRAALEMGIIHEKRGEVAQARAAFERCLALEPEEHQTALHQQAKAGLARLAELGNP